MDDLVVDNTSAHKGAEQLQKRGVGGISRDASKRSSGSDGPIKEGKSTNRWRRKHQREGRGRRPSRLRVLFRIPPRLRHLCPMLSKRILGGASPSRLVVRGLLGLYPAPRLVFQHVLLYLQRRLCVRRLLLRRRQLV